MFLLHKWHVYAYLHKDESCNWDLVGNKDAAGLWRSKPLGKYIQWTDAGAPPHMKAWAQSRSKREQKSACIQTHGPLRHRVQINLGVPLEMGLPRSCCMPRSRASRHQSALVQHLLLRGKLSIRWLSTYLKDLLEFSHVTTLGTLGYLFFLNVLTLSRKGPSWKPTITHSSKLKTPSRISHLPFTLVGITLQVGMDKKQKWFYDAMLMELYTWHVYFFFIKGFQSSGD